MKVLRKILGVVVLVLMLMFAAVAAAAALHKGGALPPVASLADYTGRFRDAPWWLVAVGGAVALFWLISGLSLLRNTRQAFVPYLAGFAATLVLWWFACQAPKHGMTFAPAGREHEIGFFAGLVVLGFLVWLTDRRKRYRPSAD